MYKRTKNQSLVNSEFLFVDLLALYCSLVIAMLIRYQEGWKGMIDQYHGIITLVGVLFFISAIWFEPYHQIYKRGFYKELLEVVKTNLLLMISMVLVLFITSSSELYSRLVLSLTFVICIPLTFLYRECVKHFLRSKKHVFGDARYLLLVTKREHLDKCMKKLKTQEDSEAVLKGIIVLDDNMKGEVIEGVPIVGSEDDMVDYVKCNIIDEVFLCLWEEEKVRVVNIAEKFAAMGTTVHISIEYEFNYLPNCEVGRVNGIQVITSCIHTATRNQLILKRCLDIIGGIVGIAIMGLLTIFVAPVIYIQSPGPIIFSQNRVGKNGRIFKIYKFRTMYPNAEELKLQLMEQNQMDGFMFKMEDDPRIFPFGKILRKLSIDEFPQFINVLKGDMSLVGTRPPTVDEYRQYELHHKSRLAMTPGLTGMWQVSGRSSITDFEEVVKLDQEYIKNWSFLLDIKILLETVQVVLTGKGSM